MQKAMAGVHQHIALFGGTFCPIHLGHLQVALFLQKQFCFDEFIFLPNKAPVLDKTATALLSHRMAMLKLALAPYPAFKIDRRELERETPSFMVDTLVSFRGELADEVAISLIIGSDSFQQFHRWHDWQTILTLCNLIVVDRKGQAAASLPKPLNACLISGKLHEIRDPKALSTASRGGFYRCNAEADEISSTEIRDLIQKGRDAGLFLPAVVWNYIKTQQLFR